MINFDAIGSCSIRVYVKGIEVYGFFLYHDITSKWSYRNNTTYAIFITSFTHKLAVRRIKRVLCITYLRVKSGMRNILVLLRQRYVRTSEPDFVGILKTTFIYVSGGSYRKFEPPASK